LKTIKAKISKRKYKEFKKAAKEQGITVETAIGECIDTFIRWNENVDTMDLPGVNEDIRAIMGPDAKVLSARDRPEKKLTKSKRGHAR
jgi:hypothetical protein